MENKNNKKIKILLIAFISVVLVALITMGLIYYFDSKAKNNTNPDLGQNTPVGDVNAEVIESTQEGRNLQNEIKSLNATYSDAKAWLKVPGTNIDTPVFQSSNNDRYLRHDRDNKKTKWGETFLDYRINTSNMSNLSHFIIYGHNTETNDHFTPLLNYKKEDFYDTHQIIEMSTLNGNYKFQVFAAYVTDINFYYIETDFADKTVYSEFLNTLKSKSMYNTGVSVSGDDTILTLSTCDYTRANGRFVVQAKLIK